MVERAIFPRLKAVITVNEGIAEPTRALPHGEAVVLRRPQHAPQAQQTPRHRQPTGGTPQRPTMPRCSSCRELSGQGPWRGASINALSEQSSWHLVVDGAGEEWEWAQLADKFNGRLVDLPVWLKIVQFNGIG